MLRSVLAVLAGIVVLTVTSFAIEAVVSAVLLRTFPQAFPGPEALSQHHWVRAFTFAYGLTCVAAGGYAAARVARRQPVKHALAMGLVQAALTMVAMLSPEGTHASRLVWIATAIASVPAAVAGGLLYNGGNTDERLEENPARA